MVIRVITPADLPGRGVLAECGKVVGPTWYICNRGVCVCRGVGCVGVGVGGSRRAEPLDWEHSGKLL